MWIDVFLVGRCKVTLVSDGAENDVVFVEKLTERAKLLRFTNNRFFGDVWGNIICDVANMFVAAIRGFRIRVMRMVMGTRACATGMGMQF